MWDSSQFVFVPIFVNDLAIHGRITLPNRQKIYVSFIYGLCASSGRRQLWEDIIFCSNRFKNSPWILLGDFNVTRFSNEHSRNQRVTKAMQEFNHTIRSAELEDLKSTGFTFTWTNMRSGSDAIHKKLDRALGNWQWFKQFGDSYAHTYNPGISDHSPLSIQLMQRVQSSGRPFKFLNFWAEHPDFMKIVRLEWAKSYEGPPLRRIQLKLKGIKSQLRNLPTRPDMLTDELR
ncbi:Exo_endo_phos domain-containing protein [Cephalotus follicularis]|uniref:Exo_endo_phos domain-containing protein n=1 Tax=Cephalotus follicularis TaxID=3775 RepID=A0A1Q3DJP0_CEPFO|nr:Exo_endo_phos domain-containing protein [Cephalotus follicularis]